MGGLGEPWLTGSGKWPAQPQWCSRRGKPGLQKSPLTKAALLQKERKETEINKWRPKAVTNAVICRVKVYNWAEDQSLPTAGPRGQELQEEPVFFLPALALESLQQWGGPLVLSFLSLSGGDWTRQALRLALVLSYYNRTIQGLTLCLNFYCLSILG